MKKALTVALVLTLIGGAAYASGITEPVMEPEIIVAETVESSDEIMIFAALALIAIILGAAGAF